MGVQYNTSIVTNGLVLYLDAANTKSYPGSGTTWTDLSGNGNDGTLVNSPTFNSANQGFITLNSTNQSVTTNYTQTAVTAYSIDAWFRTNDAAINNVIVQNRGTDTGKSITFGLGPTSGSAGQIFVGVDSNSLLIQIATTITTYNNNSWYNAVGVFNQPSGNVTTSSFSIYVNGQLASTTSAGILQAGSTTTSLTGQGGTTIGYHQPWNNYFGGSIGSVKIYNTALTAAQISQNFNALRGRYGI